MILYYIIYIYLSYYNISYYIISYYRNMGVDPKVQVKVLNWEGFQSSNIRARQSFFLISRNRIIHSRPVRESWVL